MNVLELKKEKEWEISFDNDILIINKDIIINNYSKYNIGINSSELIIKYKENCYSMENNDNVKNCNNTECIHNDCDEEEYDTEDIEIKDEGCDEVSNINYCKEDCSDSYNGNIYSTRSDYGIESDNKSINILNTNDDILNTNVDILNTNDDNMNESVIALDNNIFKFNKCDLILDLNKIDFDKDKFNDILKINNNDNWLKIYNCCEDDIDNLVKNKTFKFTKNTTILGAYINGIKADKNQFNHILHRIYEILKVREVKRYSLFKDDEIIQKIKTWKDLTKVEYKVVDAVREIVNLMNKCPDKIKVLIIVNNVIYDNKKDQIGVIFYNYLDFNLDLI